MRVAQMALLAGCCLLLPLTSACRPSPDRARDPAPPTTVLAVAAESVVAPPAAEPVAQIDCGNVKCEVGKEKCCPLGAGTCQPKDEPPQYCRVGDETTGALHCDDRSDCLPGAACCWQAADSSNSFSSCTGLPCETHEVCRTDADCGTGARCHAPWQPGRPGYCERTPVPIKCGATTCSGATPICCWNPFNPQAWCAPDGEDPCTLEADVNGFSMQCLSPRDCGPETCCAAFGTFCRGECVNARIVCETDNDCPKSYLESPLSGCKPTEDPQEPGWLKVCRYGS